METLDKFYKTKEESYFESVRFEIEPLLPTNINRVLEIGCGTGGTLQWLKRVKNCTWVGGVELNEEAASIAKDKLDFFISGNVERMVLPLEKCSLDLILCLDVLEHLVDPWLTVKNLTKLLKPGGALIVSLPNIMHRSALFPLLLHDRWDYTMSGILDRTHLRFFTRKTAIELVIQGDLIADMVVPVLQMKKGSKTWIFDLITLHMFRRVFTTQYLVRGITKS